LKERLDDPDIHQRFVSFLSKSQVAVFSEYQSNDNEIFQLDEIPGKITRLQQEEEMTDFGIYINKNNREDSSENLNEMFVLKHKYSNAMEDGDLVSTVGLFMPNIIIDGRKITPCFYTLYYDGELKFVFDNIMSTIKKDADERHDCLFRVLLAHFYVEEGFDLEKRLQADYNFRSMDCQIYDGEKRYRYNMPRSRDLTDYVVALDTADPNVKFAGCEVALPGDERRRGMDRLSDFEELSTHYPLSVFVGQNSDGGITLKDPILKGVTATRDHMPKSNDEHRKLDRLPHKHQAYT